MVMIVYDNTITEINGKVGGDIYRHDHCRDHIQSPPRKIRRSPSEKQIERINAFCKCLWYIKQWASAEWAWIWLTYSKEHPKRNLKGEIIHLSWMQMFISVNINRIIAGEPALKYPPGYAPPP